MNKICVYFLVLTKSLSETRLNQTATLCKNYCVTRNFLPYKYEHK